MNKKLFDDINKYLHIFEKVWSFTDPSRRYHHEVDMRNCLFGFHKDYIPTKDVIVENICRDVSPDKLKEVVSFVKEKEYGFVLTAKKNDDQLEGIRLWSNIPQIGTQHVDWSGNSERGLFEIGGKSDLQGLIKSNIVEKAYNVVSPNSKMREPYVEVYFIK